MIVNRFIIRAKFFSFTSKNLSFRNSLNTAAGQEILSKKAPDK